MNPKSKLSPGTSPRSRKSDLMLAKKMSIEDNQALHKPNNMVHAVEQTVVASVNSDDNIVNLNVGS